MGLKDNFIRRGYIPTEFIPPFKSESLADAIPLLSRNLLAYGKPFSRCGHHSIPKLKHFRRVLSLPNPLHQSILAESLDAHWGEIQPHINRSQISLSIVEEDSTGRAALRRKAALDDIAVERSLRSSSARYVLKADLSRFYHTLYTHTVPWALHSKTVAKTRKSDRALPGNAIDSAVRNTQDQQTLGIPVGPETSDLIAEVIGASIDEQLQADVPNLIGIRYVDDFHLYFGTRAQAEQALTNLIAAAKEFELEVNQTKTEIIELPESLEPRWKTELRAFTINEEKQRLDLLGFFSIAFELANEFPGHNVLKYAVARSIGVIVKQENWALYESFLLTSLMGEPALFPVLAQVLTKYRDDGYPLDLDKLSNALWEICFYHCKFRQGFEVAWALWLAKVFQLIVPDEVSAEIATLDDPVVAIVALDLRENGLITNIDTSKWNNNMTGEDLYSASWLLAYEARVRDWLPSKNGDDYIAADPFFSEIHAFDVHFYDVDEGRPAIPSIWEGY
jgi:Reverse transcriptase (RNA-dependent DNA polymerase)